MRYFELGVSILPPRLADDANSKIQIIIQVFVLLSAGKGVCPSALIAAQMRQLEVLIHTSRNHDIPDSNGSHSHQVSKVCNHSTAANHGKHYYSLSATKQHSNLVEIYSKSETCGLFLARSCGFLCRCCCCRLDRESSLSLIHI